MIKWIAKIFPSTKKEDHTDSMKPEVQEHQKNNTESVSNKFLIVGLGNIGAEYVNTRHNIGFKIVDHLAKKEGIQFETAKLGSLAQFRFKGRTFFLLKPNTYMNLSGKAVQYWMDKENIPLQNLFVITDDLNLPFGTIRIKPKGSDGGHNGLKNINLVLNTNQYTRFRFGISDEFKKGKQVDYVLGEWDDNEKTALPERYEIASEIIKSFGTAGLENTMTTYNGK
ncbi:aminoacyl-tRNA hydrolase [Flavobacterium acetivorans]|uniref:aminoacyl-tRNA hydrolase n=1 Tax=Flavobacterium acetivorans TaxID=2893883 RepID=UPI001E59FB98|nr:aminoacyl-tRNA hydrolase [Flavobacterium sp. F-29]UFH36387.1 aminoacyl-tRNA hydrolase [Flavobacterium sp. F-29]